ncbi:RNA polymerase sigma factor [Stieleria neptunia]|uniref:RNA polymerase sigma factor n=1 Tax=Stieleria neptunia TaxID=2527979 RepID=A0A518I2R5_9BACT|nr:sigma-70 family RNA polymerase sigma factor [Stieleria neptunia]QDV47317.1 RNA polymerase sigma factor [Stieleria neptunia]
MRVTGADKDEITLLLQSDRDGEALSEKLFPLIYGELRRMAAAQMAREKPGQTLQPTALVHEAYLRLVGDSEVRWQNRAHFFSAAARSMRQILVNRAVKKKAQKHGGDLQRLPFDEAFFSDEPPPDQLLALDEALHRLEAIDTRKGQVVMMRYFGGLSIEETATALGMSAATVKREWQFSRSWLYREMTREGNQGSSK